MKRNLESNESVSHDKKKKIYDKVNEERQKDYLIKLMLNINEDELIYTCQILTKCLILDDLLPVNEDNKAGENEHVESILNMMIQKNNVLIQKTMIWVGLYLSPSFVKYFCPPQGSDERTLINPRCITEFIYGEKSDMHQLFVSNQLSSFKSSMFVTLCTKNWFLMQPWLEMDKYNNNNSDRNNNNNNSYVESITSLVTDNSLKEVKIHLIEDNKI